MVKGRPHILKMVKRRTESNIYGNIGKEGWEGIWQKL